MNTNELEEIVRKFSTYNDYLDSMLTKEDLMFLERKEKHKFYKIFSCISPLRSIFAGCEKDKEMCRELITLGYHSNKKIFTEEEFVRKKAEIAQVVFKKKIREMKLCGSQEVSDEVLMQSLAKREEDNLAGRLATIIFLRDINSKNEEVSSYIDFADRLKREDWTDYFNGRRKLVPSPSDLSYYNWRKEESTYNSSPNFEVVTDNESLNLYFICKKDGKAVEVNPKVQRKEGEKDPIRQDLTDTSYLQAVLFDHLTDRALP